MFSKSEASWLLCLRLASLLQGRSVAQPHGKGSARRRDIRFRFPSGRAFSSVGLACFRSRCFRGDDPSHCGHSGSLLACLSVWSLRRTEAPANFGIQPIWVPRWAWGRFPMARFLSLETDRSCEGIEAAQMSYSAEVRPRCLSNQSRIRGVTSISNFGSRGPCGVRGYFTNSVDTPWRFSAR